MLTGLYPHSHGVPQNNIPLSPDVSTIAELLRPQGYATGYVGKWHLGNELGRPALNTHGFEFWVSTEDTYTRDRSVEGFSDYHQFLLSRGYTPPDEARDGARVFSRPTAARLPEEVGKPAFQAAACIRFLETYRRQPFLLMVNFLEPHPPYNSPFDQLYDPALITLPESWYREMEPTVPQRYRQRRQVYAEHNPAVETNDERGWKALKARYWGSCTLIDKYVGRILDRLEALGLAGDTVVVYSTDHGDMMGEHRLLQKSVQYEGATHVPLIVRAPGLPSARGRRLTTPLSQVHLVPTLLDLIGQPVPAAGGTGRPFLGPTWIRHTRCSTSFACRIRMDGPGFIRALMPRWRTNRTTSCGGRQRKLVPSRGERQMLQHRVAGTAIDSPGCAPRQLGMRNSRLQRRARNDGWGRRARSDPPALALARRFYAEVRGRVAASDRALVTQLGLLLGDAQDSDPEFNRASAILFTPLESHV